MDIQKNKAAMASFVASILLAAPSMAQVYIPNIGDVQSRWHPEPPPVLQKPCIVIDKVKNITYMIGYDSQGSLVFYAIEQSMCSANWATVPWISLPYPGGGKPYYTEQCFLTSTNHFAVQYLGGLAIWDHWGRTWTYRNIPCTLTYPNNAALVYQNQPATIDDILINWVDAKGTGHLTGVQLLNDTVNACNELSTPNVPNDMTVAGAPNNGQTYFLFGPKKSCYYTITAAGTASQNPVATTSECNPLPALDIREPRTVNYGGAIWIFGKNNDGLGVWSVNATGSPPYTIIPRSQGAPVNGNYTVADCGTGIIVYGGCTKPDGCSTNLKPGEPIPPVTPTPPTVIYVPPTGGNNGGGGGGGGGNGGGGGGGGGGGDGGGNGGGGGGGGGDGGGNGGGGGGGGGDGGGNGGGGNGGGGNGGGGNGGGGNGGGGNGGGGNGGGGGGGGSWIPPPPTGVPTGIPSGGPTIVPPGVTGTISGGNPLPTTPGGGLLPGDGGSKTSGTPTGAIVGGIIGAIALICLIALLFVFARRRRRRDEVNEHGGPDGVEMIHNPHGSGGGIPPLAPVGPIGDLDQVVVEDKDLPGGPSGNNNYPGGPSGGANFPGGPSGNGSGVPPTGGAPHNHTGAIIGGAIAGGAIAGAIGHHKNKSEEEVSHGHVAPVPVPGGPSGNNNYPGGPSGGNNYPGGPSGDSSFPPGPSGSGHNVPPTGATPNGKHNHTGAIIGGAIAAGAVGAAIGHHKNKSEEKVTNGHVVPVPVPGGPSDKTEIDDETQTGRGSHVVPVPGGPTDTTNTPRPTGPGGVVPVGGSSSTTTTTETTTETTTSGGRTGIFGAIAGAIGLGGAAAVVANKHKNDSSEKIVTSKTTVTTTKNGGRIYTTTGTGGRTVITERTETGTARHVLTGVVPGTTTIRTITQRTESGEEVLIPVEHPEGDERHVIEERDENGKIRYIIGGLIAGAVGAGVVRHVVTSRTESDSGETTRIIPGGTTTVTSSTRIVTERGPNGEPRQVITGDFSGNAIRVITERTTTGETRYIPTNEPTGELHHVITERSDSGVIRYIIGGIIAGGAIGTMTERTESGGVRTIPGGVTSVTSSTRIITERTSTGEIRYIIVGGFSGNAIRVITEKTSSGEIRLIPTNEETGELRHVITERSESGEIRYIIGGVITGNTITRVIMGPRIVTERTSTGEIRYVIVDQYNGNAIRTKFERHEETGEFVHIPVKEPEGELRYVTEERTETGEIRKVIGAVITGNVTTTTRTVSGGTVTEGSSTTTSGSGEQIRIVSERNQAGEVTYYHITNGPDGQEIRTVVERTEDGGFRIPGGAIIVGAGAKLIGNNHQSTTTTRVVGGGQLTPAEQAANKTQITLKLSIMRYERADASSAVPAAAVGTVLFSKFKMIGAGAVNIDETAYSHVEETKAPQAARTIKWMKVEPHWKREAGMLQHLKSDRYISELYTLYSLPTFAEYRYVSILGSFSRTLESYIQTETLSSQQIRQMTLSLSDALRWCHEHHVVHLNVRPASFYLEGVPGADAKDGNGQLVWKLWNFGHARFVGETVDTSVTTVTYAAPEILNGRKKADANVLASVSMDRWSLGLILYELHTKKTYFSSSNFAEFQLASEEGTAFEPALEAIQENDARKAIRGLLETDPEKRYTHEILREVYFGKL